MPVIGLQALPISKRVVLRDLCYHMIRTAALCREHVFYLLHLDCTCNTSAQIARIVGIQAYPEPRPSDFSLLSRRCVVRFRSNARGKSSSSQNQPTTGTRAPLPPQQQQQQLRRKSARSPALRRTTAAVPTPERRAVGPPCAAGHERMRLWTRTTRRLTALLEAGVPRERIGRSARRKGRRCRHIRK